jgi:hypothetical protein
MYIKYLLLLGKTPKEVFAKLSAEHLDTVGHQYIEGVRRRLQRPDPFHPTRKNHLPSAIFLRKERVYRLFHRDELMREAFRILGSALGKEKVESMLIVGAPAASIAKLLNRDHQLGISPEGVKIYAFYFYNLELVDRTELRTLLEMRKGDSESDPHWNRAYYQDSRRAAAAMPQAPFAAMVAQIQVGLMPAEAKLQEMLKGVQIVSLARTMQTLSSNGPDDAARAKDYMTTMKLATDLLAGMATPESEVVGAINRIGIKTSQVKPVPLLAEVSEGRYTRDLLPTGDAEDDDDQDVELPEVGPAPKGFRKL